MVISELKPSNKAVKITAIAAIKTESLVQHICSSYRLSSIDLYPFLQSHPIEVRGILFSIQVIV